jgi:polar amino acid transport system permease protein
MILSSLLALIFGVLLTIGQLSKYKIIHYISVGIIELCRNIPTVIWLLFFYYVLPELLPNSIKLMLNNDTSFNYSAAILGLSISCSGYISEIIRGGIMSVSKEQRLAAYTLGHSHFEMWRYIIAPQALQICLPSLISRLIHNMKNSSLALTISVHEIVWATQQIESITFRGIEATLVATVFFLIINYIFSRLSLLIEKKFKQHIMSEKSDVVYDVR